MLVSSRNGLKRGYTARAIGVLAVFALFATGGARAIADTLQFTATEPLTLTAYGGSATTADGTVTLSVAQYDPSQHLFAQLQSVNVQWQAVVDVQSFQVTNTSNNNTTFDLAVQGKGALFAPGTTNPALLTSSFVENFDSQAINANSTVSGSGTTSNANSVNTNPANLVTYTGSGTVTFDISGNAADNLTFNNGNGSASVVTLVGGTVTVTYTFSPVPEPANWAFALTGVATGGFVLRRKSRGLRQT